MQADYLPYLALFPGAHDLPNPEGGQRGGSKGGVWPHWARTPHVQRRAGGIRLGMSRLDRFRAPQVDSDILKKLEKLLQTVESFGFEFWVFGTKCIEVLGVWHDLLGVWHAKLGVWLRCWGNPHMVF